MTKTGVEKHESVKVGIVWGELLSFMQSVEVVDKGGYLHLGTKSVLDNGTEWVCGGALGEGEFGIAVGHALWTNEDEVEGGTREDVSELEPDLTRERRLGTSTENEEADWWRSGAETLDALASTGFGRVEGISQS